MCTCQTLKDEQLKLNEELTAYKNRLGGSEQQKTCIKNELIQFVSRVYFTGIVSTVRARRAYIIRFEQEA